MGETEVEPDIGEVWRYWLDKRQPRFAELEPSQARLIRKGITAVGVNGLKAAIDALLASDWHRERSMLQLSTLLKTRPGGATLRDQLEVWIERSPSPAQVGKGGNGTDELAKLRKELGVYERSENLRPGDYPYMDQLRALIAELEAQR